MKDVLTSQLGLVHELHKFITCSLTLDRIDECAEPSAPGRDSSANSV